MKLLTVLIFVWIIMKVSPAAGFLRWQPNERSILFEGTEYSADCVDSSPTQEVSLLKDGALISVFNQSVVQMPECANIDICFFIPLGTAGFILRIRWNNLTIESSGVYTCQVNGSYSVDLPLEVSERKATCETAVRYREEYFVGEELMLTCYNPFEDSGLIAGWYLENGTKLQETETGSNPASFISIITLEEKYNSTSFDCFLIKNDTVSEKPFHSCSIGPIFVYNSSFIHIESFNGSYIGSRRSVTFNCRIIPQDEEVTYNWVVDPSVGDIETSTSEVGSILTLSNFSLGSQDILDIKITCEGMLSDMNFTAEYNLKVFNESLQRNNSFFILIIVISAVLTTMVIIIIIVVVCCIIVKRCRKTTLGISEERITKHNEVITAHEVVLNKYDKGRDYEEKYNYEEEDKRKSILARLPDGRFHLAERRPSEMSNISNGSSFSNASGHSVQETGAIGEIYDDPPMRTSIPLEVITPNVRPSSTPGRIIRPSFEPPSPPLQYDTTIEGPTTTTGNDFTNELKNRLSSSGELPSAPDAMIYDDPPSDHLYYSDDESPVYASAKKDKSFYNEPEDQYAECESGVNEDFQPEDNYAGIMETD